jgi:hypothetical protein
MAETVSHATFADAGVDDACFKGKVGRLLLHFYPMTDQVSGEKRVHFYLGVLEAECMIWDAAAQCYVPPVSVCSYGQAYFSSHSDPHMSDEELCDIVVVGNSAVLKQLERCHMSWLVDFAHQLLRRYKQSKAHKAKPRLMSKTLH